MEALYSKLYDKYTKLKAKKASEIEQLNLDQEEKFKTYVSAADELIGYLTSEKDRSAKDEEQEKYEKMLIEENQKNKQLSEEIERLHRKEFHSSTSNDMLAINQVSGSSISSGRLNNSTKRKRSTDFMHEKEVEVALEHALDKENMTPDAIYSANQPKCCRRRLGSSDASDTTICMFQELVESLVDLKFSTVHQTDDILLTAVHESSGYTFSLGWVKNTAGEEELMYRVSSLGTFERVAPEWMRDVMLFSKSMCRMFFKRLSCIVKLHD
ncbi:hypothetical protein Ccrd_025062 [Cynara cardunculus var. scolymus]|uniref:DUF7806 domain-containing protein n=1 Tax=Cynara cardunculus var. scolymus TaxID=59895 RepID=A0A103XBH1_CYNCS|nr:hypothetical protein Ccrd_025062 [Cynara cardunculus var. scolymus]